MTEEMTDADVMSALQEAVAEDTAAEQADQTAVAQEVTASSSEAPVEGAPVEEHIEPEGQAPAQVEETGEVEQPTPEPEEPFNPDELPPELLAGWKQMQAAFTPRLQKAAAITKRFEELGGEEAVEQALALRQQLSDPENWPALYESLFQAMENAGFEFDDPAAPAAPEAAPMSFDTESDDPELAPLMAEIRQLRARSDQQQQLLEAFNATQERARQMAEEELRQTQHLAELNRQVMAIRQANPSYDDEDVRAIVELGSFYGDDLLTAQQRYEGIVSRRLSRYFDSKKPATKSSLQPAAGAGVLSDEDKRPETVEEAAKEAEEFIRRLQAEGGLDF